MTRAVRVLVVDDSAYNRRTIIKVLNEIDGVEVVDYACNGEEGLRKAIDLKPDLITLDLEMPRMDGFSFLRILMQNCPIPVIVVSSRSGQEDVFRALEFGAVDFVAKPSAQITPELFNIREDLIRKVIEVAGTDMGKVLKRAIADKAPSRTALVKPLHRGAKGGAIKQVVIGASTGGPPALQAIFSAIQNPLEVGFAISQHMPPGFTRAFADRLNKFTALEIKEAANGDRIHLGRVLIAPGGMNLTFRRRGDEILAQVSPPEPKQRYTPSVDVMFNSASDVYQDSLLGVVLTGMGNDGARGTRLIKSRGGLMLAEAEESSVVFGMPKEAIATGCVDGVVPLSGMCGEILKRCGY
jgi:two-component system, chemotaxis family, protein-glutamate methylesterase/glutaminase